MFLFFCQYNRIRCCRFISKWSIVKHLCGFSDYKLYICITVMRYGNSRIDLLKQYPNSLGTQSLHISSQYCKRWISKFRPALIAKSNHRYLARTVDSHISQRLHKIKSYSVAPRKYSGRPVSAQGFLNSQHAVILSFFQRHINNVCIICIYIVFLQSIQETFCSLIPGGTVRTLSEEQNIFVSTRKQIICALKYSLTVSELNRVYP